MDVVVQSAGDGANAVAAFLPRVQILPLNRQLKLLWDQEIAGRYVVTVRRKVGHSRHAVDGAAVHVLLEILANQIEAPQLKPRIQAPRCSLGCGWQREWRQRTVGVHFEIQTLR